MLPSLFSVLLDYVCNYECAHCSVGSSPRTPLPMPREILQKAMRGVRQIPTAKVVVFTGGEPTIRKSLLLEGIRLAKEANCIARVVTNGWWATTPDRAAAFVGELKAAGLDELNTSWDDFHEPFASFDTIVNLVRAGLDAELRLAVGTIRDDKCQWDSRRIRAELVEKLGIPAAELVNKVFLIDDYPTPTGTGATLDIEASEAWTKLNLGCTEVLKTVSIHPTGHVKVCCGHAMFYNPDLTIGNLHLEELPDMCRRAQGNLVYWWIHMLGPKRILDKLGVVGNYSSICHACHVLLGEHRQEMLDYLSLHKPEVFLEDVLCSDHLSRAAKVLIRRKDEIEERLRVLA